MQDEVLAHRLGLIPIKVDPRLFQPKLAEEAANELNTVVLKLRADCRRVAGNVENASVSRTSASHHCAGQERKLCSSLQHLQRYPQQ